MTVIAMEREVVTIGLGGGCTHPTCHGLVDRMLAQLATPHYREGVALMEVPASLEQWCADHRTARRRMKRCHRLGYRFDQVDYSQHNDDIYAINTSLPRRQGRPMSDGYRSRPSHGKLPVYPCALHNIRTYGVFHGDRLAAYLTLYRLEELALVSMIIGHGSDLPNDVMYLLFAGVVADQVNLGGWFYYNLWNSGQDGLRYYKSKLGFREATVEWSS